jgi:hypothetical protein
VSVEFTFKFGIVRVFTEACRLIFIWLI